ncbi:hypothetical protein BUALT_Bualt05G0154500 [Buddleja alternifolia]|uniref:Myb/SANT-like domain-containing protein n=1 Tax=Buddleja alternifolia TaxID=168488 RepID=A0AAV6XKY1_9LAMI|nr:hypothetical protein BUALT_Bualt05G0154500 [Buddleja alternifolia]
MISLIMVPRKDHSITNSTSVEDVIAHLSDTLKNVEVQLDDHTTQITQNQETNNQILASLQSLTTMVHNLQSQIPPPNNASPSANQNPYNIESPSPHTFHIPNPPEQNILLIWSHVDKWGERIDESHKVNRVVQDVADNGFCPGYLNHLADQMMRMFPGTDIRSMPHINSKINVWKKNFETIYQLLSTLGIGWNETIKMLDGLEDAWDKQ